MSFKRSISFNLGKRKFNLKIYQLFLLILIFSVAVTGTTYAYFMTSAFIKDKITGNMATVDAKLTVERVTPNNNNKSKLVPMLDAALNNALQGNGGKSSCVDNNNNVSCEVYKITIINNGSTNLRLDGNITLQSSGGRFDNLKWEELADSTTRKTEYLTNATGKSPLVSNLSVEAHGSKEFYIAVWISETNSNQIDTNTGTYGGEVEFTDINGVGGVTATFKEFDKNFCNNNGTTNLSDCLLISDKYSGTLEDAKTYISSKTPNFNDMSPLITYEEKKESNITNSNGVTSTTNKIYFGTSYSLSASSGIFYISNSKMGLMTDYKSTSTQKYYTCMNQSSNGGCGTLYVIYDATSSTSNGNTTYRATKVDRYTTTTKESNLADTGIYKMEDDYGDSYYYRGKVTNNYVSFAGYIWRIIRINGDGSIRLIYSGTNTSDTSSKTSIGTSQYNSYPYDASSVGYKYSKNLVLKHTTNTLNYSNINAPSIYYFGTSYTNNDTTKKLSISGDTVSGTLEEIWGTGNYPDYKYTCFSTSKTGTCATLVEITSYVAPNQVKGKYHSYLTDTYENTYKDTDESTIKPKIDSWYKTNIEDKGYSKYLSDAIFCNDRTVASGDGSSLEATTIYGAYNRNANHKTPSLKCPRQVDQFTKTKGSTLGNGELTYPVGLITADEVAIAGGKAWNINSSFWLKTGQAYWTMSPSYFSSWDGSAYVWSVSGVGTLSDYWTASALGVRPVINLKSGTLLSKGNGTSYSPYEVVTDE